MRFGIHSNDSRDRDYKTAIVLSKLLIDRNCVPVFEKGLENTRLSSIEGVEFNDFDDVDVIVSIGGDGTFLSVISDYRYLNKPFVGVNKGSIGFLTEISDYNIEAAFDRIINGKKHKVVCINDSSNVVDFNGRKNEIISFFEKKFPEKSSYEK